MKTLEISLSDPMKKYVEERVVEGGYSTASEYFRELILEDFKRRSREKLEAMLLGGLDSGPSKELTAADWEEIRRRLHQRLSERDPNLPPSIKHLTVYIPEDETT